MHAPALDGFEDPFGWVLLGNASRNDTGSLDGAKHMGDHKDEKKEQKDGQSGPSGNPGSQADRPRFVPKRNRFDETLEAHSWDRGRHPCLWALTLLGEAGREMAISDRHS
ncbi:hypothetical protein GCM10007874_03670 [Labrys miyagiensis]|uniref:Uncharacterized protein n=1 Tax=Labrys miyagiensis TaxID=346912 RepID=A0ABQ6CGI6_9HYPH|nr:hypothetical protein GCM10007874_03670 [Labrys miyagiensis]